jgi:hypothetical protein
LVACNYRSQLDCIWIATLSPPRQHRRERDVLGHHAQLAGLVDPLALEDLAAIAIAPCDREEAVAGAFQAEDIRQRHRGPRERRDQLAIVSVRPGKLRSSASHALVQPMRRGAGVQLKLLQGHSLQRAFNNAGLVDGSVPSTAPNSLLLGHSQQQRRIRCCRSGPAVPAPSAHPVVGIIPTTI